MSDLNGQLESLVARAYNFPTTGRRRSPKKANGQGPFGPSHQPLQYKASSYGQIGKSKEYVKRAQFLDNHFQSLTNEKRCSKKGVASRNKAGPQPIMVKAAKYSSS